VDKELRILMLEDSSADAGLEEYELRKAGLVFTLKIVDTEETFVRHLDEFLPDIILSDYDLPTFHGLAALRIAKEKCPDVPFILVTGKLGEEFAIEKLKEGATDYVLKGNLKRLVPSVKRALEEAKQIAERKRLGDVMKLRLELMEYAVTHSLEEFLQKTLDEIGALTDSPIGFYHFVEPDQKTLSLQAWSTRTEKEFCVAKGKGMHYGIDEAGVWVDCVYERRPVIHNDYLSLLHRKGLPEGHAPVIRELVVPIMHESHIVAILGIGNKPTEYTEKDVDLVSFIADVAWEITKRKQAEELLHENQARLDFTLRSASMGVWHLNLIENKRYFDDQVCHLLGINPAMFTGSAEEFFGVVHPDDRETIKAAMARTIEQDVLYEPEYRAVWPDGSVHYITARGRLVRDDNGRPFRINGIIWDITSRKQAEKELLDSEAYLRTLMATIQAGVMIIDVEKHTIADINMAAANLIGAKREEIIGKECHKYVCPAEKGKCPITDLNQIVDRSERVLLNVQGEQIPILKTVVPLTIKERKYLVESFIDITDRKRSEQERERLIAQLQSLSIRDELTGLYNRRGIFSMVTQQYSIAKRLRKTLMLVFIDLDGMKQINDLYGHQEGDSALKYTANILKNTFRETDIIVRIGGDEFAVFGMVLEDKGLSVVTTRINEKLEKRVGEYAAHSTKPYKLSLSYGIAFADPEKPFSFDSMLSEADQQMYVQKEKKKGSQG
jgi:diguanylate cyclase (GGDEF)-like protein/PAS domain S-box-containing protein